MSGSTSFVISISLLLLACCYSNGESLDLDEYAWKEIVHEYAWKEIVQERIQNVPEKCLNEFLRTFRSRETRLLPTFYELLADKTGWRRELCIMAMGDSKLRPLGEKDCGVDEYQSVMWNFLCYQFDLGDSLVPPVSAECAIKYWFCSRARYHFINLLYSKIRGQQEGELRHARDESFVRCLRQKDGCEFELLDELLINGKLVGSVEFYWDSCDVHFLVCYELVFDYLFRALSELRKLKEQRYLCGTVTECLLHPGIKVGFRLGVREDWKMVCTKTEAEVADKTMCSDTAFTPDFSGTFLLDGRILDAFDECFKTPLFGLRDDKKERRSLCESSPVFSDCIHWSTWHKLEPTAIVSNFLCYDLDNTIVHVSFWCREALSFCLQLDDVSYMEKNRFIREEGRWSKSDWCDHMSDLSTCITDYDEEDDIPHCSNRELDYIQSHMCHACPATSNVLLLFAASIVAIHA